MARTKQVARKVPRPPTRIRPFPNESRDRSTLLQLMGFPMCGPASAKTVKISGNNDWSTIIERLSSHPEEAAIKDCLVNQNITEFDVDRDDPRYCFDKYPLFLALTNELTPITKPAVEAFIQAYPKLVTNPRSKVLFVALENPRTSQDVIDLLIASDKHLCRQERTQVFQIMGFSSNMNEFPGRHYELLPGHGFEVDWQALEQRLTECPEEAGIVCPGWRSTEFIFPLEAALLFSYPPVPLSVVQLLLQLCPEAVTIPDSSALYLACSFRRRQDAEVVKTILRLNPSLAASDRYYMTDFGELGLPIHEAVHLPCAAEVLPALIEAHPKSLSDTTARCGNTPLRVAVEKNSLLQPAVLRVLLEQCERYKVDKESGGQLLVPQQMGTHTTVMSSIIWTAYLWFFNRDHEQDIDDDDNPWQNLCLCLKAAGAAKSDEVSPPSVMWNYPLLHGVIEFGRKQAFFDKIFVDHRGDLSRVDPLGRSPLTVAIEMVTKDDYVADKFDPIHFKYVIEMLLNDHRGGSSRLASLPLDSNGTLPLHRALHQGVGIQDGLLAIIEAYPNAVAREDPGTKLLPCLLAACAERATVPTIYELIKERPNLIADLISMKTP